MRRQRGFHLWYANLNMAARPLQNLSVVSYAGPYLGTAEPTKANAPQGLPSMQPPPLTTRSYSGRNVDSRPDKVEFPDEHRKNLSLPRNRTDLIRRLPDASGRERHVGQAFLTNEVKARLDA